MAFKRHPDADLAFVSHLLNASGILSIAFAGFGSRPEHSQRQVRTGSVGWIRKSQTVLRQVFYSIKIYLLLIFSEQLKQLWKLESLYCSVQ